MRIWTAALGAVALGFASHVALADEVVDGALDRVDPEALVVALVDGQEFVLNGANEFADIEAGEKMTITYRIEDGKNVVNSILPAEPHD